MKRFGDVMVTKQMESIIKTKMVQRPQPYIFHIVGTPGANVTTRESAERAWVKIKDWATKHHADVKQIHNQYRFAVKPSMGFIEIKITDPAAFAIEQLLQEAGKEKEQKKLETIYQ